MPSTVIAEMNYDPARSELLIRFTSGLVYIYKDVPESEYRAMRSSGAKGNGHQLRDTPGGIQSFTWIER